MVGGGTTDSTKGVEPAVGGEVLSPTVNPGCEVQGVEVSRSRGTSSGPGGKIAERKLFFPAGIRIEGGMSDDDEE